MQCIVGDGKIITNKHDSPEKDNFGVDRVISQISFMLSVR
jgi:hypothetical protein